MTILFVGIAAVVSVLVGCRLYRILFDGSEDFWDCVGFSLKPDLFSLFRGQYWEDVTKSFKLSAFLMAMGVSGGLTYWGLASLFE